ncbi:pilus assembly protein [Jannaschia sp. S6380]|uniref:TadE/TadG family type IV pilus assembly protein n=1 Tax=Jannaschia sp. S6380 TaxID=2926408 RepID=UPI001FF58919|nr:pilus assembly protein [Jannaschia sp. S6380]
MIRFRNLDPGPRRLARAWTGLADRTIGRLDRAAGLSARLRERGAATVEFVLLMPAFIMVFISSFDSSLLLIRQVMLERAVDIAVREVRLDTPGNVTQNQIRNSICNRARILPDCNENLLVELSEVQRPAYSLPDSDAPCVNQLTSISPRAAFATDRTGKLILLRACYSVRPALPMAINTINRTLASNLVNDDDGTIRMVTMTAFVVEAN